MAELLLLMISALLLMKISWHKGGLDMDGTVSILTETLVNILLGTFAATTLCWAFAGVQSIINDFKREKRERESAKRDEEYHLKRMSELNK